MLTESQTPISDCMKLTNFNSKDLNLQAVKLLFILQLVINVPTRRLFSIMKVCRS